MLFASSSERPQARWSTAITAGAVVTDIAMSATDGTSSTTVDKAPSEHCTSQALPEGAGGTSAPIASAQCPAELGVPPIGESVLRGVQAYALAAAWAKKMPRMPIQAR